MRFSVLLTSVISAEFLSIALTDESITLALAVNVIKLLNDSPPIKPIAKNIKLMSKGRYFPSFVTSLARFVTSFII